MPCPSELLGHIHIMHIHSIPGSEPAASYPSENRPPLVFGGRMLLLS